MPGFKIHYIVKRERLVFGENAKDAAEIAKSCIPVWEGTEKYTILQVLGKDANGTEHESALPIDSGVKTVRR